MPVLEVIQSTQEVPAVEQKRVFVQEVVEIFREVLSTPADRLRIVFYPLGWEDSSTGLLDSDSQPEKGESDHES